MFSKDSVEIEGWGSSYKRRNPAMPESKFQLTVEAYREEAIHEVTRAGLMTVLFMREGASVTEASKDIRVAPHFRLYEVYANLAGDLSARLTALRGETEQAIWGSKIPSKDTI